MTAAAALFLNAVLVAVAVAAFTNLSVLLGPRRRLEGAKGMPYETGMPPVDRAADRMSVLYHRFAVLFVIFDVDLSLLVPWVLLRDRLTPAMMASMTGFILLVGLTLAYVWRKGALECR